MNSVSKVVDRKIDRPEPDIEKFLGGRIKVNRGEFRRYLEQFSPTFDSLATAWNYLATLKEKIKRKAKEEEFPISTAMPEDRKHFLEYCISLLKGRKWKKHCALLRLRLAGYSTRQLAFYFKVPETLIDAVEKQAIEAVKVAIKQTKATNVPLVGAH